MRYSEWRRQRLREARALEEANDPQQGKRRARSRRRYAERKEHSATMQAAFLEALRNRVAHRCYGTVVLPVGEVLVRQLSQVLSALDKAAERKTPPD